jgi:hypothetical protein
MRLRLLVGLLAGCALLLVPAAAQAKVTVGIAENQPRIFADPQFQALGAKHTRVVASWNVMTSGDDELPRLTQYLQSAQAAGVEPLVTFEHTRGDASRCAKRKYQRKLKICKLPSAKAYEANVKAFFAAFPFVKVVAPFNEANHFTQPTARNPRAAARFAGIVKKYCKGCRIIGADLLDQADDPKAKSPTFVKTVAYAKALKRHLRRYKVPTNVCGVHNYSDVNRFRDKGTRTLIRALGCKQIWLTETGGLYEFGSFKESERRQLRATRYLFNTLVRKNRKVKRVYVYTFYGNVTPRFDAGLVADGTPRSAYAEVQKRIAAGG